VDIALNNSAIDDEVGSGAAATGTGAATSSTTTPDGSPLRPHPVEPWVRHTYSPYASPSAGILKKKEVDSMLDRYVTLRQPLRHPTRLLLKFCSSQFHHFSPPGAFAVRSLCGLCQWTIFDGSF